MGDRLAGNTAALGTLWALGDKSFHFPVASRPRGKETTFACLGAIYIDIKTVWNPDSGEGNDASEITRG